MTSYTDETVSNLIINKLTKAQYDAIATPSETELYIVTDEEALPSQTGQSGKYLTTNGTTASWGTVDALPSQSGNNGKFLSTNGTTASWTTVTMPTVDQTYNASSSNAQSGTAVSSAISSAISSVYKPAGSVIFANLPTPSASNEGNVYNVTNAFTTTSSFVEGAGINYPAGTNVVIIYQEGTPTYYAWYINTNNNYIYTLSPTPSVGDEVLAWDDRHNMWGVAGYDISSYENNNIILEGNIIAERSSDNDILGTSEYKFDTLTGAFQPLLVSGTNIKTINNTSILGSGNIDIQGGGTDISSNKVNGAPLSNTSSHFFGISTSAATDVEKVVSIPSITELTAGVTIIVLPTITSTVENATLKLNNFAAYPMRYGNAAITTTTDAYTWTANIPSVFVFDGDYWRFVCQGYRQTYTAMSVSEGTTGTATTARSMRADRLKSIIQGTTLTGLSTSTSSAVTETDTVTTGIGKLQAQVNNKVDKVSTASKIYATDASGNQTTLSYNAFATGNTIPVRGSSGTIEASTPYADSHVATKQYVDNLIPTIATTSTAGLVKPDGISITIDSNGTISAASGGAYAMVIVDYTEEDE